MQRLMPYVGSRWCLLPDMFSVEFGLQSAWPLPAERLVWPWDVCSGERPGWRPTGQARMKTSHRSWFVRGRCRRNGTGNCRGIAGPHQGLGVRCSQPATLYLLAAAPCVCWAARARRLIWIIRWKSRRRRARIPEVLADLGLRCTLTWRKFRSISLSRCLQPYREETTCRSVWTNHVYIFDLYTIALSKIARGFESDLEDVMFMIQTGVDSSSLSWRSTSRVSAAGCPVRYRS